VSPNTHDASPQILFPPKNNYYLHSIIYCLLSTYVSRSILDWNTWNVLWDRAISISQISVALTQCKLIYSQIESARTKVSVMRLITFKTISIYFSAVSRSLTQVRLSTYGWKFNLQYKATFKKCWFYKIYSICRCSKTYYKLRSISVMNSALNNKAKKQQCAVFWLC